MTLRRDFLAMTAGAVAARTVLPLAAKAEETQLAAVARDQFPRLARHMTARAALAEVQAGLPACIFHEWMEGGLRMAARAFPGDGTFRDITLKLAMAEGVVKRHPLLPRLDAELIAVCAGHPAKIKAYNEGAAHLDMDDDPLWADYSKSRDFISNAKPTTTAGMLAKAQAAKAEAVGLDGQDQPHGSMGEIWAWDLVGDLLAMGAVS